MTSLLFVQFGSDLRYFIHLLAALLLIMLLLWGRSAGPELVLVRTSERNEITAIIGLPATGRLLRLLGPKVASVASECKVQLAVALGVLRGALLEI